VRFIFEELVVEKYLGVCGVLYRECGWNVFAETKQLADDCAAACAKLEHVLACYIALPEECFAESCHVVIRATAIRFGVQLNCFLMREDRCCSNWNCCSECCCGDGGDGDGSGDESVFLQQHFSFEHPSLRIFSSPPPRSSLID
jgi:hypothetical protein